MNAKPVQEQIPDWKMEQTILQAMHLWQFYNQELLPLPLSPPLG